MQTSSANEPSRRVPLRPYVAPRLVVHGSVAKITATKVPAGLPGISLL